MFLIFPIYPSQIWVPYSPHEVVSSTSSLTAAPEILFQVGGFRGVVPLARRDFFSSSNSLKHMDDLGVPYGKLICITMEKHHCWWENSRAFYGNVDNLQWLIMCESTREYPHFRTPPFEWSLFFVLDLLQRLKLQEFRYSHHFPTKTPELDFSLGKYMKIPHIIISSLRVDKKV